MYINTRSECYALQTSNISAMFTAAIVQFSDVQPKMMFGCLSTWPAYVDLAGTENSVVM